KHIMILRRMNESENKRENDQKVIKSNEVYYKFIVYDYRTKGLETYKIPRDVKDGAQIISYEDNSDVYMIQENGDELEIIEWKLGSDEQTEPITVPINRKPNMYATSCIKEQQYEYASEESNGKNIG